MEMNHVSSTSIDRVETHIPCPCGESSDAYCTYSDGHGFCFSCNKVFNKVKESNNLNDYVEYIPWRSITKETMERYKVLTKCDGNTGEPQEIGFPYGSNAFKIRSIKEKKFWTKGDTNEYPLFGMTLFNKGSFKSITVTEGELDALSFYQVLGSKYPVVSLRSSSISKDEKPKIFDYLNSFEKIYLALDNDANGKKATKVLSEMFDPGKVYFVKFTKFKDANEFLVNGAEEELKQTWWNSKRIGAEGIISSYSEIDKVLDEDERKPSIEYPWLSLTDATYGIRTSEVTLITALEGVGKTEIVRAIEHKIIKDTDENIGIIHLEEGKSRCIKGLVGIDLGKPVHLPNSDITREEIKAHYRKLTKRDERVHVYSHFGSDDPSVILDTIRFLVTACHCKYVTLDHISMVVSGIELDDERRTLDFLSTNLATMTETLDFGLILVSHVNDDGKTRGSRNISKVAHTWIHLDRDDKNKDPIIRNTTNVTINKNRFGSITGPVCSLYFNPKTFLVSEGVPEKELPS